MQVCAKFFFAEPLLFMFEFGLRSLKVASELDRGGARELSVGPFSLATDR